MNNIRYNVEYVDDEIIIKHKHITMTIKSSSISDLKRQVFSFDLVSYVNKTMSDMIKQDRIQKLKRVMI